MNWAMSDQGMVSGINFLTGLLLARYLGLAEFGRYTLAWLAIEFLVTFQQCMIVAPMMSIGPQTPVAKRHAYFGAVVVQQALFSVFAIVAFFGIVQSISLIRPDWSLDGLAAPMICAALAVQLQNFVRRYLFTCNRGGSAFLIDVLRYPGQLVVLFPLVFMTSLDAADALWISAWTSAASSILGCFLFGPIAWDSVVFRHTARRHWDFAKWLLMSEIMRWGTTNLYMVVAGVLLGTAAVGAIRAAQLLLGVCNILMFGLENFALARASQHFGRGGLVALLGYLKQLSIYGGIAVGGIALLAAVVPEFWLGLVKNEYQGHGNIVRWWALFYVLSFIRLPIEFGLRTIERTRTMFGAHLAAAAVSAITVYPFTVAFGITGVMAGTVLVVLVRLVALFVGFHHQVLLPSRNVGA